MTGPGEVHGFGYDKPRIDAERAYEKNKPDYLLVPPRCKEFSLGQVCQAGNALCIGTL